MKENWKRKMKRLDEITKSIRVDVKKAGMIIDCDDCDIALHAKQT